MRSRIIPSIAAAVILLAVVVTACTDRSPVAPSAPGRTHLASGVTADLVSGTPQILACPSLTADSTVGTVGPGGGTVAVGMTRIDIPAGAVQQATDFAVVVPASTLMEVEIHAVGQTTFLFARPVIITIDYSRCASDAVPAGASLQGVHIDLATGTVLDTMGGLVDTGARTVSFLTGHLSGYAVAY